MSSQPTADSGPVTLVVSRRVRPDRQPAYEDWLRRMLAELAGFPGYLGVDIHRPPAGSALREYTIVYRFADLESLKAFEAAEPRKRHLAEAAAYAEADAQFSHYCGLEFWFDPPPGAYIPHPIRWRMVVVMIAVVYSLVVPIGQLLAHLLPGLQQPLRLLISIALQVPLMTYLVMPRITRLLSRWLYRTP